MARMVPQRLLPSREAALLGYHFFSPNLHNLIRLWTFWVGVGGFFGYSFVPFFIFSQKNCNINAHESPVYTHLISAYKL